MLLLPPPSPVILGLCPLIMFYDHLIQSPAGSKECELCYDLKLQSAVSGFQENYDVRGS